MKSFAWLVAYWAVGMGAGMVGVFCLLFTFLSLPLGEPLLVVLFIPGVVILAALTKLMPWLCDRSLDA